MKKWQCVVCGLIYDESLGWPDDDIAPAPSIAAVRSPHGDVLLPPERGLSRAAGPGFHLHEYAINKHGCSQD